MVVGFKILGSGFRAWGLGFEVKRGVLNIGTKAEGSKSERVKYRKLPMCPQKNGARLVLGSLRLGGHNDVSPPANAQ